MAALTRILVTFLALLSVLSLAVGGMGIVIGVGGLPGEWRSPHAAANLLSGLMFGALGFGGLKVCQKKLKALKERSN
jgi:hypothetical protein